MLEQLITIKLLIYIYEPSKLNSTYIHANVSRFLTPYDLRSVPFKKPISRINYGDQRLGSFLFNCKPPERSWGDFRTHRTSDIFGETWERYNVTPISKVCLNSNQLFLCVLVDVHCVFTFYPCFFIVSYIFFFCFFPYEWLVKRNILGILKSPPLC